MGLPSARVAGRQDVIWDWVGDKPITSKAQVRNFVGDFFEEASMVLTGAKRLKTDGRAAVCPDLGFDGSTFLEVKACRGSLTLYDERLEKDLQLIDAHWASLTYLIWLHHADISKCKTKHEVYQALTHGVDQVLVIPFFDLYRKAKRKKKKMCKYRQDSEEKIAARVISRAELIALAKGMVTLNKTIKGVYRFDIGSVQISGRNLGLAFPPLTQEEKDAAAGMLWEFTSTKSSVTLAPAPRRNHEGHKIRVVESRNPLWYRRLCRQYRKKRKTSVHPWGRDEEDTDIRREFVAGALSRLSRGVCRYEYDFRLRPYLAQVKNDPIYSDPFDAFYK